MYLSSLEITNVRNLQNVSILPHHRTNFIVGPNGSGKTSLLESISLLSNGRSFRNSDTRKLIRSSTSNLVVFGRVLEDANSSGESRIGFTKAVNGDTQVKINGVSKNRVSDLAKVIPTIAIDSNSIDVIEGGPAVRRSLLDWGMFHVEPSYLSIWSQYRIALKNKNALLKSARDNATAELIHWNRVLADYGTQLDTLRVAYVEQLRNCFNGVAASYLEYEAEPGFLYSPGWNKDRYPQLDACLNSQMTAEIDRHSCLYGPHRAELKITWGSGIAKDICSRGQKKLLLYGVRLAQIALMNRLSSTTPILLLDDLPAEMDKNNIESVTRFLTEFPCQTFITAINEQSINETLLADLNDHKMFHVEHGTIL
jgi:DNA replication and repair protein RecF